jgi:cobyric acid synthase
MEERDIAILATHVVTAMKHGDHTLLDPVVANLSATPWHPEVLGVVKAVKHELERQKYAKKSESKRKGR